MCLLPCKRSLVAASIVACMGSIDGVRALVPTHPGRGSNSIAVHDPVPVPLAHDPVRLAPRRHLDEISLQQLFDLRTLEYLSPDEFCEVLEKKLFNIGRGAKREFQQFFANLANLAKKCWPFGF